MTGRSASSLRSHTSHPAGRPYRQLATIATLMLIAGLGMLLLAGTHRAAAAQSFGNSNWRTASYGERDTDRDRPSASGRTSSTSRNSRARIRSGDRAPGYNPPPDGASIRDRSDTARIESDPNLGYASTDSGIRGTYSESRRDHFNSGSTPPSDRGDGDSDGGGDADSGPDPYSRLLGNGHQRQVFGFEAYGGIIAMSMPNEQVAGGLMVGAQLNGRIGSVSGTGDEFAGLLTLAGRFGLISVQGYVGEASLGLGAIYGDKFLTVLRGSLVAHTVTNMPLADSYAWTSARLEFGFRFAFPDSIAYEILFLGEYAFNGDQFKPGTIATGLDFAVLGKNFTMRIQMLFHIMIVDGDTANLDVDRGIIVPNGPDQTQYGAIFAISFGI